MGIDVQIEKAWLAQRRADQPLRNQDQKVAACTASTGLRAGAPWAAAVLCRRAGQGNGTGVSEGFSQRPSVFLSSQADDFDARAFLAEDSG